MTDDHKIIGKNVEEQRLKKGMKRWEVVRLLEISLPEYTQIERGAEDFTINDVAELAKVLRVHPYVLYKGAIELEPLKGS